METINKITKFISKRQKVTLVEVKNLKEEIVTNIFTDLVSLTPLINDIYNILKEDKNFVHVTFPNNINGKAIEKLSSKKHKFVIHFKK